MIYLRFEFQFNLRFKSYNLNDFDCHDMTEKKVYIVLNTDKTIAETNSLIYGTRCRDSYTSLK